MGREWVVEAPDKLADSPIDVTPVPVANSSDLPTEPIPFLSLNGLEPKISAMI